MTHPRWKVWDLEDNFWYQELQERNELLLRKMQQQVGTLSPKIPRKIHQIWLGALDQLPSACQKWIETWIAKHPSWEYKLWTDSDIEAFHLKNQKAFDQAENYGEKSDILRYEILEAQGGLYVDVDFECLHPMDHLVPHFDFIIGISNTPRTAVEMNNGLIASIPHHPILQYMIHQISTHTFNIDMRRQVTSNLDLLSKISQLSGEALDISALSSLAVGTTKWSKAMSTIERTGPGLLTRSFMKAIGWSKFSNRSDAKGFLPTEEEKERVIALPCAFFYPLPNDLSVPDVVEQFPPQAMAVHYWSRTWQQEKSM